MSQLQRLSIDVEEYLAVHMLNVRRLQSNRHTYTHTHTDKPTTITLRLRDRVNKMH